MPTNLLCGTMCGPWRGPVRSEKAWVGEQLPVSEPVLGDVGKVRMGVCKGREERREGALHQTVEMKVDEERAVSSSKKKREQSPPRKKERGCSSSSCSSN